MLQTFFASLAIWLTAFSPSESYHPAPSFQEDPIVNEIITGVPGDLEAGKLLIPRYDMIDMEEVMHPKKRKWALSVNRSAKTGNTTIKEIFDGKYPFEYKMANLQQVEALKAEGYRYFLDLVWMPKQMKTPRREALVPAFEKFDSANRMFSNRNSQIHYYFYIRDLQTGDAYITSNFKGSPDAYIGMKKFLAQVNKELGK